MKIQLPNWEGRSGVRGFIQRRPWSVLSWASGIVALTFISYYGILALSNPPSVIGQQFVLAEFPPQNISPWFFAKPITWFSYASFLYWAFGLEAQRPHFLGYSDKTRRFMFAVTAVVAFGALYEIFFNFMLWGALEVLCNSVSPSRCTPDIINNPYPNLRNPLSLTFSTKVVTLVFALAVYSLYYLRKIDKEIDRRTPTPVVLYPRQDRYETETIRNIPVTRSFSYPDPTKEKVPSEISPPT